MFCACKHSHCKVAMGKTVFVSCTVSAAEEEEEEEEDITVAVWPCLLTEGENQSPNRFIITRVEMMLLANSQEDRETDMFDLYESCLWLLCVSHEPRASNLSRASGLSLNPPSHDCLLLHM